MNILLLEDNTSLNKAIKKVLQLDNHYVKNFYDGEDALNAISNDFDLYILDINVPNINGLELLDLIYNKNNTSKVIIITSNTDINSLQKAYKLGCIDYIKRPFHIEELRIKTNKLDTNKTNILSSISLYEGEVLTKNEKVFMTLLLELTGKVATYQIIDENVYKDKEMSMDGLRALVRRLRAKLTKDIIVNVLEEGYRLST